MKKLLVLFFAMAAFSLVVWYGYRAFTGPLVDFPVMVAGIAGPKDTLPDSPAEWKGRIDYRALDRQLVALSLRPEMAGLAVAIVEDGELRFVSTYGVTDKRSREPVTPETVFRWASVSKTVAGTLAAKLTTDGKIDLNQPLASWNSTLRLPGGANDYVTLAQLMSHRTGLTKNAFDRKLEDGESPGLLRNQLSMAPLQCVPGECHTYQNIAFDASSEILGAAAGEPYPQAVEEDLFKPLGMTSAKFGMAGLIGAKSWAHPHRGYEVRTPVESYWRLPAAAGVNSNIMDMARWMQAQMGENIDVLSSKALTLAHAPLTITPRLYSGDLARALSDSAYGLGWRSVTYAGHRLIGHSGAVDGFRATMIFDPANRTGVVAMWNSGWGIPFRIPFAALDSYYSREISNWLDTSDIPLPEPPPVETGAMSK